MTTPRFPIDQNGQCPYCHMDVHECPCSWCTLCGRHDSECRCHTCPQCGGPASSCLCDPATAHIHSSEV